MQNFSSLKNKKTNKEPQMEQKVLFVFLEKVLEISHETILTNKNILTEAKNNHNFQNFVDICHHLKKNHLMKTKKSGKTELEIQN